VLKYKHNNASEYIGWFMTCGHYCRRWFPMSLWSKKLILIRFLL